MSPAAQTRAKARTQAMLAEMPLDELRRARALSQARLAEALEINQSEVSRIEHRTDLYLSTLRSYIEAMGGELEIIARFPDGAVRVKQLDDLDKRTVG
jgi:transcriptional regulator with XRE-family HTH domain